jgi:hypothetical protein
VNLSLGRFVRALIKNDWRDAEAERRAMTTDVDTQGGWRAKTAGRPDH